MAHTHLRLRGRQLHRKLRHDREPLTRLQQKTIPFTWSHREQCSFNDPRDRLCSVPILTYPDFQLVVGTLTLDTDANEHANDVWNVIAFASRDLSVREMNHCTTRKEMLAFIYAAH